MVGLSATLGGKLGLELYADYFSDAAHFKHVMPIEDEMDWNKLCWRTWTWPASKQKQLPIHEFVKLIEEYHVKEHLPTVVLAEKPTITEKLAENLDALLKRRTEPPIQG